MTTLVLVIADLKQLALTLSISILAYTKSIK